MTEAPDQIVVEVRIMQTVTDQPDKYFRTELIQLNAGRWPEMFSTVEKLKDYLLGVSSTLSMTGYHVTGMTWEIREHGKESSGKRWTFSRTKPQEEEEFDADGKTIPTVTCSMKGRDK